MIATDEDALICDLAETYHVLDYKSLPVPLVATLCVGLKNDSRIKMKMRGDKATARTITLAMIHDRVLDIAYMMAGKKGNRNYLSALYLEEPEKNTVFDSPEAYEEARNKFRR